MARPKGTGHVYRQKTSRIWWAQWWSDGVRRRESTGTDDYEEALRVLRQKMAESIVLGTPAPASLTVASLVEAKLANEKAEGFKDTASNRQRWEGHLRAALGDIKVRDLKASTMREYRARRRADGAPDSTINRELSVVRAAYRLAWKDDLITLADIPHFPMASEAGSRRKGFLRYDQYQQVFDACMHEGLWLASAFQVANDFGWRRGEVFPMLVGQLDFSGKGSIHLPDSKNGEGRLMPMTDKVREMLAQCIAGKAPTDFVFTRDGGRPVKSHYKAWRRAVAEAEVPSLHLHDMRRTATRNLVRAGVPKSVAQQVTGHLDPKVFDRYNITDLVDLEGAAEALDRKAV